MKTAERTVPHKMDEISCCSPDILTTEKEGVRRVGIMGGTFDPIHLGHLILAENALDTFHLDEVRFIPSGHSYFKDNRPERVSSREDRLAMTRLAVQSNSHFSVSDMEIRRAGYTYTCETMEQLARQEPGTAFYFLCGADSLAQMHTWYHPERIFRVCTILAAMRGEDVSSQGFTAAARQIESEYGARVAFLPVREIQISSTEIRKRIRLGQSVRYLIPPEVAQYIRIRGLYQGEMTAEHGKQGQNQNYSGPGKKSEL